MTLERRRLLVVDDSEDITRLLSAYFRRSGYDVHATNNSEAAMELTQSHSIEVALIDIEMPVLSGLELLKLLRASGAPIGIIMVSGYSTLANRIKAFRWGADFMFAKPIVDLAHLESLVETCLFRLDDWKQAIRSTSEKSIAPFPSEFDIETCCSFPSMSDQFSQSRC